MIQRPRSMLFVALLSTALACGGDSAAARATQSPTPTSGPIDWTLVFADEFDTAGTLDPAKWGYEIGYIRNNEKQVLHLAFRERAGRRWQPRDRRPQGGVPGLRLYVGEHQHARAVRVHCTAA